MGRAQRGRLCRRRLPDHRREHGDSQFPDQNKGADVCADLTIVEATDFPNSPIGLIFWFQDWDNYYVVYTWADGWVEVRRIQNGNTSNIFTEETLALKKGVGETH